MAEEYFVGTKTSERYPIWTRANVGEVFPDPVALSTFDFAMQNEDGLQMSELGFRDAYIRIGAFEEGEFDPDNPVFLGCLLYTSPSPRDYAATRMPSSA